MPDEKEEVKQAVFHKDARVNVTFSAKPVNRREASDEPSDQEFHIVYMDLFDGRGRTDIGEAYIQASGEFEVELYVTRSAQPYAFQIVGAADRFFDVRNVSIEYVD